MKKITIYQTGVSDVEILDDDNEPIEEYCQKLSKLFHMSNVVILKTSTTTFIGRPSQLTGLMVKDIQVSEQQTIESDIIQENIIEEKNPPEKTEVDIITDID